MLTDSQIVLFVAAGMVGFVAVLAVAWQLKFARYVVLGMIFLSAIAAPKDETGIYSYETWLLPLQTHRPSLYLAFGIILLIAGMIHYQRCSLRAVGGQSWMLLLISLYSGLLWMVHEPLIEGVQTFVFLAATVGPLAIVVPALLRERRDLDAMLNVVLLVNIISVFAVFVQFVVNRDLLTLGVARRFTGMLANPQHAAVLFSVCSIVVLSVLLNTKSYRYWWFLVALLGVNMIFLGWTGSRTGSLMFVIGATMILYRRIGRAILLLPVAAIAAWIAYTVAGSMNIELGIERLITTDDTRTATWVALWQQGLDNMLIGAGMRGRLDSESSYLTAFATFGVGMFLLVLFLVLVAIVHCWKLFRIGMELPEWGRFTDLVLAFNAMFFLGAFFEGYVIARISFPFVMMLVFTSIGAAIISQHRTGELFELDEEPWYEDQDELLYDGSLGEPEMG